MSAPRNPPIRELLLTALEDADQGRFLYATLDPEDAARIMDDCLNGIQEAVRAATEVLDNALSEHRGTRHITGRSQTVYERHRVIPDPERDA